MTAGEHLGRAGSHGSHFVQQDPPLFSAFAPNAWLRGLLSEVPPGKLGSSSVLWWVLRFLLFPTEQRHGVYFRIAHRSKFSGLKQE